MTFASLEFALLLLACLSVYWLLPQRGRLVLLLLASYVFYCYWHAHYGVLILISTALDYFAALLIERTQRSWLKRAALLASILGNLGLLGYFKYTNFALDSLRALLGPLGHQIPGPLDILLPAGISFYTFQTMAYTIDVYRGVYRAERSFLLVATFVAYFPQLVAGPIERAATLVPQLKTRRDFDPFLFEQGIRLLLLGLIKKTVFADRMSHVAYPLFFNPASGAGAEFVIAALTMLTVIYLDFSAYTDMARGTSLLFGIRLSPNFVRPFAATSVGAFWQRWHITMSTWVRDYLYRPLGGFRPRNPLHHVRITLVTMALVGLWHGARWNFVVWGLLCGVWLGAYHLLSIHVLRRWRKHAFLRNTAFTVLAWCAVMYIHAINMSLFFAPDLARAGLFLKGLFTWPPGGPMTAALPICLGVSAVVWSIHIAQERHDWAAAFERRSPAMRAAMYVALFFVAFFGAVRGGQEFIYFQF